MYVDEKRFGEVVVQQPQKPLIVRQLEQMAQIIGERACDERHPCFWAVVARITESDGRRRLLISYVKDALNDQSWDGFMNWSDGHTGPECAAVIRHAAQIASMEIGRG